MTMTNNRREEVVTVFEQIWTAEAATSKFVHVLCWEFVSSCFFSSKPTVDKL